jgi:23S rRNA pseudouridine1911/1915/1917 synthase
LTKLINEPRHSARLRVLYEDNHVLVALKPAGMPVQADRTGDESLVDIVRGRLKEKYNKPGNVYATAVHRLDRPATGVVIFAKTSKAAARLSESFREGRIRKTYLVLVEGVPREREGRLEGWIVKDKVRNVSRLAGEGDPQAKMATLSWRILKKSADMSLLEIDLETGRSHQIRVQLAEAGMHVAGDRKYGAKSGMGGMIALHAARISFPHPVKDETVSVSAQPPESWEKLLSPMR